MQRVQHNHICWHETYVNWIIGCHPTMVCDKADDHHEEEVPGILDYVQFYAFVWSFNEWPGTFEVCLQTSNNLFNWIEQSKLTICVFLKTSSEMLINWWKFFSSWRKKNHIFICMKSSTVFVVFFPAFCTIRISLLPQQLILKLTLLRLEHDLSSVSPKVPFALKNQLINLWLLPLRSQWLLKVPTPNIGE